MSAAELATMFHLYFLGSSEGLVFDVPSDTYPAALWTPLGHYLAGLGVRPHTGRGVDPVGPRRFRVRTAAGAESEVHGVVLAADVPVPW